MLTNIKNYIGQRVNITASWVEGNSGLRFILIKIKSSYQHWRSSDPLHIVLSIPLNYTNSQTNFTETLDGFLKHRHLTIPIQAKIAFSNEFLSVEIYSMSESLILNLFEGQYTEESLTSFLWINLLVMFVKNSLWGYKGRKVRLNKGTWIEQKIRLLI
mmetsp:Transcript_1132/g.1023  ORF Transcript_1132/g.1023 Transcript_1132/m.1023 type:complete len:158 (+) Transcript_1132:441-914(+)